MIGSVARLTRSGFKGVSTRDFGETIAPFLEAIFSYNNPIPDWRKSTCKTPLFASKEKNQFETRFQLDLISVFPLLIVSAPNHKSHIASD